MNSLKRFLLVEDSLEVANEVKWLFNDTGYLTGGVNNIAGALKLIQEFCFSPYYIGYYDA